ncbi:MAG: aminotransferase class I/II-fold pyridoxal phosphate-dependent enzyme, partial [Clostridia bacterium]|nr:aminotransferase class I/II-fold pyridoxal phosphate-dependent enzyme [Clostridia bacterium]
MKFSNRMEQFGESIFSNLLEIKRKRLKDGVPVIDLSIGAPNIPPAKHILEALCTAATDARNYIYAINDQTALLEAVSFWYKKRYGVDLNPQTEVCSLLGSQEGFLLIPMTILNEGDLVLVPDPCYPIFADGPRLAGAQLYYLPQKKENDYLLQLQDIPENIARKAKLMI